MIDWNAAALATLGGTLIGLASLALMVFSGRIAGISGIVAGVMARAPGDLAWRVMFILGLISGGAVVGLLYSGTYPDAINSSTTELIIAGLLVGIGTRLGSGCTSGHGVCGMSRLSGRSIVATLTFMATGALTVFVMRHLMTGA